jgi:hypothetical protein
MMAVKLQVQPNPAMKRPKPATVNSEPGHITKMRLRW